MELKGNSCYTFAYTVSNLIAQTACAWRCKFQMNPYKENKLLLFYVYFSKTRNEKWKS